MSTKVLTSILLLSWGCRLLEDAEEAGRQTDPCNIDSQVLAKKDAPAKDKNASEKSSPLKQSSDEAQQDRSSSEEQKLACVETMSGSLSAFSRGSGDNDSNSWRLHSMGGSVVEHQSQVLRDQSSTPAAVELFKPSDDWEVDSADSDCEFHSSLDDSTSGYAKPAAGTPVVDYDDEKKYK